MWPKEARPACLAVSTSTNSSAILNWRPAAYDRSRSSCAGMEKPSRSWSFEETRASDPCLVNAHASSHHDSTAATEDGLLSTTSEYAGTTRRNRLALLSVA